MWEHERQEKQKTNLSTNGELLLFSLLNLYNKDQILLLYPLIYKGQYFPLFHIEISFGPHCSLHLCLSLSLSLSLSLKETHTHTYAHTM